MNTKGAPSSMSGTMRPMRHEPKRFHRPYTMEIITYRNSPVAAVPASAATANSATLPAMTSPSRPRSRLTSSRASCGVLRGSAVARKGANGSKGSNGWLPTPEPPERGASHDVHT